MLFWWWARKLHEESVQAPDPVDLLDCGNGRCASMFMPAQFSRRRFRPRPICFYREGRKRAEPRLVRGSRACVERAGEAASYDQADGCLRADGLRVLLELGQRYLFFAVLAKGSREVFYHPQACNWTRRLQSTRVPVAGNESLWIEELIVRQHGPGEPPRDDSGHQR